jgi:hypothetical protein
MVRTDVAATSEFYYCYPLSRMDGRDERVMANYEGYGFRRLRPEAEQSLHARLKPRYDQQCVFMYAML